MTAFAILFGIFLLAVVVHGLFAGYETGFVSANPIRIRYLAEEEKAPRAIGLLRFMERPDKMLTFLLLGDNVSTVIGTIAITQALKILLGEEQAHWVMIGAIVIATPMFLVFSEIVPKSVFRTHPNRLVLLLFPAMRSLYTLTAPIVFVVSGLTRWFLRIVGGSEKQISPFMSSLEDVRSLVDESAEQGTIERAEQEMIHNVIGLQETQAKEIMVPRIDVQALPETATRTDVMDLLVESGRTRILIYTETVDTVVGTVNAYDILMDDTPDDPSITRFIRETPHVPDTMKVDELLKLLKRKKQHMAVVTDEYGGTDGIITMEDILEEIFGEIQDEHDHEGMQIQRVGANAYIVDARMPLEDMAESINRSIEDEAVETVGGWVMHVAGKVPSSGEVIELADYRIVVLEGDANFVSKIRLELLERDVEASDEHSKERT